MTSKHSLGGLKENAVGPGSHAQVGERWLRKHLAAAGKTEEQLAQTLWEKKWTAVAEVSLRSLYGGGSASVWGVPLTDFRTSTTALRRLVRGACPSVLTGKHWVALAWYQRVFETF